MQRGVAGTGGVRVGTMLQQYRRDRVVTVLRGHDEGGCADCGGVVNPCACGQEVSRRVGTPVAGGEH